MRDVGPSWKAVLATDEVCALNAEGILTVCVKTPLFKGMAKW